MYEYKSLQRQIITVHRGQQNLINVVFPTPGGPITKMDPLLSTKSLIISALPDIARPTRQVRPIICIFRFLIALIRCRELLIPDLLSSEKSPTYISSVPNEKPTKYLDRKNHPRQYIISIDQKKGKLG